MNPIEHNLRAWEKESSGGGNWSTIVPAETMEAVHRGEHRFSMSPDKRPIPADWLGPLDEVDLLCLAGGGGQQGPILAGMGAKVTVYDFSPNQLSLDRLAAETYGLEIKTVEGDMRDLSVFPNQSFDIVIHPASNMFVDNILPVWNECYRVLRPNGRLIAMSMNPIAFAFGRDQLDVTESPVLHYSVPYSDVESLKPEELKAKVENGEILEYGHTLENIIGGQLRCGFLLKGFQEGYWGDGFGVKADKKFPQSLITYSVKLDSDPTIS
ncbi:MAG: class I SAM-dependent methyltransferase [Verrucomicrobiota bacterium]